MRSDVDKNKCKDNGNKVETNGTPKEFYKNQEAFPTTGLNYFGCTVEWNEEEKNS